MKNFNYNVICSIMVLDVVLKTFNFMHNTKYTLIEWCDRRIVPLPDHECNITILTNEGEFMGMWKPSKLEDWFPNTSWSCPTGYLGTVWVKITDSLFLAYWKKNPYRDEAQIGFHAWKQNNSEFQYYKIVTDASSTKD